MTLIIGHLGSMGRRHSAILRHLDEPFAGFDAQVHSEMFFDFTKYDKFIVATPTPTHLHWLKKLDEYGKPILCEKPLSWDIKETEEILNLKSPLSIQMQYKFFDQKLSEGDSWYNYFNHGKDSIVWDCFQIVALSRGNVYLKDQSPTWDCALNGKTIDLREMDRAYVWSISNFLKGHYIPREVMFEWHRKVAEFEEKWKKRQSA